MNENKKIALITGAGSGIGAATAQKLASSNIHVIIAGRTMSRLENTEDMIIRMGGTCTIVELDMKDFIAIDKLGIEIFKRWKKLDILISNAAILGTLGPIHHQSGDEFLEVMIVNAISNQRLIRSIDPLLKNGSMAKALFLSSSVAINIKPYWGAYSVSKASLEQIVKIWSAENKHNNLSISIINPGITNTKMRRNAMPGENHDLLQDPREIADRIFEIISSDIIYKGETIELKN